MTEFLQSELLILLIAIFGTSIVIAYAAFIYHAVNRYNIKSLELIKNYEELKNTQERMLLETEIEIREQTFQYISKEIHDNITQSLSLANLTLNCLDQYSIDYKAQLSKTKDQVSKALNDLNDLSKSLDSDIVESHGLSQAVRFEIEKYLKFLPYDIAFTQQGLEKNLESNKELFLFRIIQESLNNIIKHANANEVKICFQYETDQIIVSIEDDGIGFDPEFLLTIKKAGKMAGLKNMRQRTEVLGGSFMIDSKPNIGTIIRIIIPYYNEHENNSRISRRS